MMWKYIYAAFLMIAFTACHTNKTLEKSDKPASTANYTLPEHLSVSASFRMFWDAWNADLRQSGNNLEKYIPSELLIKRFSLHNQNGNYLLTGYLHTAADFKYNPQNEMFQRFKTKCSFLQNEAYLCKSFFLP